MAPHSSTLAWKIPWTEGPGGLQSMGSRRIGHDWVISLSLFTFMHQRRKWQPTPVFLPGESQGQGAWWASVHEVVQSPTQLKQLSICPQAMQETPVQFLGWWRKCQPTPVFLPGESQGQGAWWAAIYGVAQSQIWLKRLSSSSSSKAVYCHPAYLTYIQSTSWETLDWKKHKLESGLPGEISITSDMQMTPPLWQKVKN